MLSWLLQSRFSYAFKLIVAFIVVSFVGSGMGIYVSARAETLPYLPAPNQLITTSQVFSPVLLKGIKFDSDNPFHLQFIIDEGNTALTDAQLKEESNILVRYFLSALAIPVSDLWVNLSPYEQGRIVPQPLGATDLGRDLLAQDYILKQLSASLTYPDSPLGKKYWDNVYGRAFKVFGTTKVPIRPYHKIWIAPARTQVWESGTTVFIKEATMKVMLEEDYTALNKNKVSSDNGKDISSQVMREVILPEISKDVNTGKNFAYLRQMHNAIVLASWFKLRLKNSIYNQLYVDKKKIAGVDTNDPKAVEKVYGQYVDAFKSGVYNYAKKDFDPNMHRTINRQYYSGGVVDGMQSADMGGSGEDRTLGVAVLTQDALTREITAVGGLGMVDGDVGVTTTSAGSEPRSVETAKLPSGKGSGIGTKLATVALLGGAIAGAGAVVAARNARADEAPLAAKAASAQSSAVHQQDVYLPSVDKTSTAVTVAVPPLGGAGSLGKTLEDILTDLAAAQAGMPMIEVTEVSAKGTKRVKRPDGSPASANARADIQKIKDRLDAAMQGHAAQVQAINGLFDAMSNTPRARSFAVYTTPEELQTLLDAVQADNEMINKLAELDMHINANTARAIILLKHNGNPAVLAILAANGRPLTGIGGNKDYTQDRKNAQEYVSELLEDNQGILDAFSDLSQSEPEMTHRFDTGGKAKDGSKRVLVFQVSDKDAGILKKIHDYLKGKSGVSPNENDANKMAAGLKDKILKEYAQIRIHALFRNLAGVVEHTKDFIPADSVTATLLKNLGKGPVMIVGTQAQIKKTVQNLNNAVREMGGTNQAPTTPSKPGTPSPLGAGFLLPLARSRNKDKKGKSSPDESEYSVVFPLVILAGALSAIMGSEAIKDKTPPLPQAGSAATAEARIAKMTVYHLSAGSVAEAQAAVALDPDLTQADKDDIQAQLAAAAAAGLDGPVSISRGADGKWVVKVRASMMEFASIEAFSEGATIVERSENPGSTIRVTTTTRHRITETREVARDTNPSMTVAQAAVNALDWDFLNQASPEVSGPLSLVRKAIQNAPLTGVWSGKEKVREEMLAELDRQAQANGWTPTTPVTVQSRAPRDNSGSSDRTTVAMASGVKPRVEVAAQNGTPQAGSGGVEEAATIARRIEAPHTVIDVVWRGNDPGVSPALTAWRLAVNNALGGKLTADQLDALQAVHLMPGGWRQLTKAERKQYVAEKAARPDQDVVLIVKDINGNERPSTVRLMHNNVLGVTIGSPEHNAAKWDGAEKVVDTTDTEKLMAVGLLGEDHTPSAKPTDTEALADLRVKVQAALDAPGDSGAQAELAGALVALQDVSPFSLQAERFSLNAQIVGRLGRLPGMLTPPSDAVENETMMLLDRVALSRGIPLDFTKPMPSQTGGNGAKGGITEEGLTIETAGDGTQIPMFKNLPVNAAQIPGFAYRITNIGRNQTASQIVFASAIR